MRFLWKLVVASGALMLTSCSATWHLKRAVKKDPSIVRDTVVRIDTTIITKSIELRDTVTILDVDTITIEKDGVVVDIRRYYDTLLVDVECPSDTITVFKEKKVEKIVPPKKKKNSYTIGGIVGFILALVVVKITGQVMK